VIRLLGEMIAAALSRGTPLTEVALNVSNVTVEVDDSEAELTQQPPVGDFVALTIAGGGDWRPELRWWPDHALPSPLVSGTSTSQRALRGPVRLHPCRRRRRLRDPAATIA
jgi:hypothetical protein